MLKKEIYPKTKRIKIVGDKVYITEKLDGANLCIFKKDGEIYVAQRKTILAYSELEENKDLLYKGLYQWLVDNKEALEDIIEGSVVCGEWLGMGVLKYTVDEFDKRFYMFAKARITEDFNLENIRYDHENFIYPFESQIIPSCIGVVPEVVELKYLPDKKDLDVLYQRYSEKVDRNVEGFVINYRDMISKYVRMKNGKLEEYHE